MDYCTKLTMTNTQEIYLDLDLDLQQTNTQPVTIRKRRMQTVMVTTRMSEEKFEDSRSAFLS